MENKGTSIKYSSREEQRVCVSVCRILEGLIYYEDSKSWCTRSNHLWFSLLKLSIVNVAGFLCNHSVPEPFLENNRVKVHEMTATSKGCSLG